LNFPNQILEEDHLINKFLEKNWGYSIPAKLKVESIKSGEPLRRLLLLRRVKVNKKMLDSIAGTQSKLLVIAQLDDVSI